MDDDIDKVGEFDDEGGETVVIDRSPQLDDKTVVVDRDDENDHTVVVDRSPQTAADDDDENDQDRTVVVDRDEDRTVVVDRNDDRTIAIERDKTIAIDRRRRGRAPKAEASAPDSVINLLPAKRRIKIAPVEPGSGREAVDAIGPNVVEIYVPRQIAPPPVAAPAVPRGEDAMRAEAPSMPSVTRRSRKAGALALLVFAGACAVSVVGIVVVIVWFLRS